MNNRDWSLQAEIIFNGGGSQISYANFSYNGGTSVVDTNTSSESIANNVILKFTGEGTVNDDISIYYYKAILLN